MANYQGILIVRVDFSDMDESLAEDMLDDIVVDITDYIGSMYDVNPSIRVTNEGIEEV